MSLDFRIWTLIKKCLDFNIDLDLLFVSIHQIHVCRWIPIQISTTLVPSVHVEIRVENLPLVFVQHNLQRFDAFLIFPPPPPLQKLTCSLHPLT